jgi:predicted outer membrane repeat protein
MKIQYFYLICIIFLSIFLLSPTKPASAGGGILYAAPMGDGAMDCSSWENACRLIDALQTAVAGNQVWVKRGTHRPGSGLYPLRESTFSLKNGVTVLGGFNGTETDYTSRDWTLNPTILSGNIGDPKLSEDNSYHVVSAINVDWTARLDGFIISGGKANSKSPHDSGGGMYISEGCPTLTNLTFTNNDAILNGGGMYILGTSSSPILTNTAFTGNEADEGGGIYNASTLTVMNSAITANTSNDNGGGIYNTGILSVTDSNISDNISGDDGGGIFIGSGGNVTMTNSTISGNKASESGGGIYNWGSLKIWNSTFYGNTTLEKGGGIRSINTVIVVNSTFSQNHARDNGGGISNGGTLNLTNSTFYKNETEYDVGGIYNTGTLNYANTIITSFLTSFACFNDGGAISHNTHNLVQDGSCESELSGDPMLGLLADNGGPTLTHALLPGSIAIDSGDINFCPEADQRGVIRPQGAGCDIGAYEFEYLNLFLPLILR